MPIDAISSSSEKFSIIFNEFYKLKTSKPYLESIEYLYNNKENLDLDLKKEIILIYKQDLLIKRMPKKEYIAYNDLLQNASIIWKESKNKKDFSIFQPFLEQIVEYNKK